MNARRGLAAIALFVPLACTTKGSDYPYLPPTGAGGAGGTGMVTPTTTVTVKITSPSDGMTVSDSTDLGVSATVDVDMGTDLVDTSSVKVTVTAMGSAAAISTGQLVSTGGDTFAGTISLGALPTGSYTLEVSASSLAGVTGNDQVTLMVQGGPTLIVNAPAEGQSYNDSVSVQILVDQGANAPTATLAGNSVTLSPPTTSDKYDVYTATVWFGPPPTPPGAQTFQQLTGEQLLDVKETNGTANSEVFRTFIIDTTGPTITGTTPTPGEIVGGVVTISATITDPSGVLDSSVVAVIGDQQGNPIFTLQLPPQGSGVYSILFDALNLTRCGPPPSTLPCIVFPTISFRASDSVGNETSLGYDFSVDNMPPLADLDPPQMREMQLASFGYECSFLFDPLSVNKDVGDMPNDGCMVPQVFDLRARIEDQGNDAPGLKVSPISGIDPSSTSVYILTDNTQPLVVDTDGDGYCDAINPLLAPTSGPLTQADQVLKIRLGGVPPGGSADFEGSPIDPGLPIPGSCVQGLDPSPPKVLCQLDGFQQPTIAIGYSDNLPAIWSVEPIDPDHCMGNQLDTRANNVADGQWICMAVGTADLAGNHSVSRPMRVFVNYSDGGGFCATPPASAPAPPPCTGSYDPVGKTAALGACQTLKFTGTELYCAPGGC
ncbi:MAG TPA: hypothetical protein VLC06_15755 [Polyangia bacterium]|nr:hypothetical protein [Polyangia bacterium]